MQSSEFYREPRSELYQGDIVSGVPHLYLRTSVHALRKKSVRGEGELYASFPYPGDDQPAGGFRFQEPEGDETSATCQVANAMVLSHDCDIENDRKHRLVALIRPLAGVPHNGQEIIREYANFSYFYLPELPGVLQESYVDFRRITSLRPQLVDTVPRLAALAEATINRLHLHFFLFLTRRELAPEIIAQLPRRER
jgi:hypothetical protein